MVLHMSVAQKGQCVASRIRVERAHVREMPHFALQRVVVYPAVMSFQGWFEVRIAKAIQHVQRIVTYAYVYICSLSDQRVTIRMVLVETGSFGSHKAQRNVREYTVQQGP